MEERQDGQEFPEETKEEETKEKKSSEAKEKKSFEFAKGVLFGILLSVICVMSVYLVTNGTIGAKQKSLKDAGAGVLTSKTTREKLEEMEKRIRSSYLYDVDGEYLSNMLFYGAAAGLEDPYAGYYTPEEMQDLLESSEGEYYGIGISLLQDIQTDRFRIAGIYEGSPAWEAGLQVDDEITEVDGSATLGMSLSTVASLIKKKEGSVSIQVLRDGEELLFTVLPSNVEIPTVSARMLEDGIGYMKITEFDGVTVEQFETALRDLQDQGAEKLIFDVRDNPGGVLDAVCGVLDGLLEECVIVSSQTREGERTEYTSDAERLFDGPMTVLVNNNSASASEIFAGAIQDYALGPVIGDVTYGKGVVQRTYLLSDGSALKMTTEKYYTAGGQDIDGKGIVPDIAVELPQRETDGNAAEGTATEETEDSQVPLDETETEETEDLQMQRALEYLREQ